MAPLLVALFVVALARPARAGTAELIPAPLAITSTGGTRRISPACEVVSDAPGDDVFALRLARGLRPGSRAASEARSIRRIRLRAAMPDRMPRGAVPEQSYTLEIGRDSIVVTGATRAARLHGVETLRQLWLAQGGEMQQLRIADGPALALRGLSLDVSRGRMPTSPDLVRILDVCAAFKLNVLQLYFEDTFDYSCVPATAKPAWAIDAVTLRRIAAEARLRAIELVPIVETMAHQERLLAAPAMQRYADPSVPGRFALGASSTRALVGSMVDDVLAASGSAAVHLGCDESLAPGEPAGTAFPAHVAALAARARASWNAQAWIYADELRAHPELVRALPRDLVLVDWDYDPQSTYASLDTLAAAGLDRVVTSPGVWGWSRLCPDHPRAFASITAATDAARTRGCLGSVLAAWGDGGGEDLFGTDVVDVAWFAERAWRAGAADPDRFLARYCQLRFGASAPSGRIALDALARITLPFGAANARMLYRPILLRRRTPEWRDSMAVIRLGAARAQASLAGTQGRDLYADAELEAMRAAIGRFLAAADREGTLDTLAAAIGEGPGRPGQSRAVAELTRLGAAEASAQAAYVRAWRAHNLGSSGLDGIRTRFASQLATLDSLRASAARGELRVVESPFAAAADQGQVQGQTRRSTAGSARSAPRMNTVSGRTAGIQ